MSFLDTLGGFADKVWLFDDVANDWSKAFDSQDKSTWDHLKDFSSQTQSKFLSNTYLSPLSAGIGIGQGAQAVAGIVGRAASAPAALSHPEWGQQMGMTPQQYLDHVRGSIFDLDAQTSPGQIADASGNKPLQYIFGGLVGAAKGTDGTTGVNPYDPTQNAEQYGKGFELKWDIWNQDLSPRAGITGYFDTSASTAFDPTNLAGPAFKGYKAVTMGEKALIGDVPGRMFTAPTQVTKGNFLEDLLNTNKYDTFVDTVTKETSAARLAEHPYLKDPKKVRDTQLAAYLLSKTTDRESTVDTLMLLGDLGTPAAKQEAMQRLLAKGADQGENAYLFDRIVSGNAEAQYAAKYGTDHVLDEGIRAKQNAVLGQYINDDSNALGRAYAESLQKAVDQPVGIFAVTPKTGVAARTSAATMTAKANALYANPNVTYLQPTKAHPTMAFVDFFTKGRPSGYANTHDLDSYKEFSALISHVDQHVGGAFRTSGEQEAWANSYMAANSATDRMNLFQQLEQRGLNILAEKHGLDAETAQRVYDFTASKRRGALQQYSQDGFFSMLVDGNPVVAAGPLTLRQGANDIHIALDFRQLDKALARHTGDDWKALFNGPVTDQQLVGKAAQRRDQFVGGLDALNDIFKMSVLLRLGYTIRNLGEAGLSMAANGYLTAAALTVNPREAAGNFAYNRAVGRAVRQDARLQRRGFREDARDVQAELNDLYAEHRGLQLQEQTATDYLAGFELHADDLTPDTYQILARLRGHADRTVTYHVTTDGLPSIKGDFVATTDNHSVATSNLDSYYTYHDLKSVGADKNLPVTGTVGAPTARAERVMALVDDARTQLKAGRVLEYKVPGSDEWAPLSEVTLDSFIKSRSVTGEFKATADDLGFSFRSREAGKNPTIVAVPSFGKTLDGTANQFKRMSQQELASYARANGYGRIVVDDPKWGTTTLVLRDTAAYPGGGGAAPIVRRNVRDIVTEAESGSVVALPPRKTGKALRQERRAMNRDKAKSSTRNRDRTNGRRAVLPGFTEEQLKHMVDSGLVDTLEGIGNRRAIVQAKIDQAEAAAARRAAEISALGSKRRLHTKPGQAFYGPQGSVMIDRTNNEGTVNKLVGSGDAVANGAPTAMVGTNVKPTEARYFEGWANVLNHHFRDPETKTLDPAVQKLLNGESPADLEHWIETTPEGRAHADYLGWGDKIDQRVAELDAAVKMYMPEHVQAMIANGENVTEATLRQAFGKRTDLPDLQVRLIPGSQEQRATLVADSLIARSARRIFRALGSAPETTFARHPYYVAVYNAERTRMMQALAAKGHTHMTLDNYNKVEFAAREYARREVNQSLYTINRRTDAARQLRLIAPFYGAWENAIQRWGGFVWHNPDKVARIASKTAWAANNVMIIDENGDQIEMADALKDIESFQNAKWLLPGTDRKRPQSGVQISLQSMDVIMGGQPGAGFGPYITAPVAEVVKRNPQYEDAVRWMFPVGLPKDVLDNFTPTALKRLRSMLGNDQQFINDTNRIYMNNYIKWQQEGAPADRKPTVEQATADAQKFYLLRTATSLLAPASVTYGKEVDYYSQQLRALQDLHRDEPNGSQIADQEFLDKYPEAFIVLPPLSKNRAGALANVSAVDNMKKYSNLAQYAEGAGDLKLFGWVSNYGVKYSQDDYSSAAYTWQVNNGPLGSDLSYRGKAQAADLENDAMVSKGWIDYGRFMDVIESRLKAAGIDPASKQGVELLAQSRQDAAKGIRSSGNELWYREYADPDRAKYERRADFFQKVLSDKQFMADHGNDPVIGYMGNYFNLRAATGRLLVARDEAGGSKQITAAANRDVFTAFQSYVETMKSQNLEFAAWLNRYFENDPVTF